MLHRNLEYYLHESWEIQVSSVVQSCPTLWPHGLQHVRPPCPSPTPRVYSNSCPLSQWCHSTISSSVFPFSSGLQSVPASGSFPMSQFFRSSGQSIGALASASVIPMNIQGWFPLRLIGLSPLLSSPGSQFESINSLALRLLYGPTLTSLHDYWKSSLFSTAMTTVAFTIWTFVGKVMSLLFNMLSRFVIAFLPRSKLLLISWLQSPSTVILEQ